MNVANKPSEILEQAKELIACQDQWTYGAYARDETGLEVSASGKLGVCWCAEGAMRHTTGPMLAQRGMAFSARTAAAYEYLIDAARSLLKDRDPGSMLFDSRHSIHALNDNHGHDAAMEMFDNAIAAAKKNGD